MPENVHLISEELPQYISAIHLDINHFIECSHSMKAAKRMWVLAQWEYSLLHDSKGKSKVSEEEKVLVARMNTLAPLFASRAAALGQVVTDCKTLRSMLDRFSDVPLGPVVRHILRLWKQTLNNVPYSRYDLVLAIQQPVFEVFEQEVRGQGKADKCTRATVIEALARLEPLLEKDVEEFTRSFLIANNLLPSFRSYKSQRQPSVRNTELIDPHPTASCDTPPPTRAPAPTPSPQSSAHRTRSVPVPIDAHFHTDSSLLDVQNSERLQPGNQLEMGKYDGYMYAYQTCDRESNLMVTPLVHMQSTQLYLHSTAPDFDYHT